MNLKCNFCKKEIKTSEVAKCMCKECQKNSKETIKTLQKIWYDLSIMCIPLGVTVWFTGYSLSLNGQSIIRTAEEMITNKTLVPALSAFGQEIFDFGGIVGTWDIGMIVFGIFGIIYWFFKKEKGV